MEYVSHVLPALGEDAVEQRAVGELVDGVVAERRDPPDVARLKADLRLVEVIARAAELRLESEPEELVLRLEGSFISVREHEVRELLAAPRAELGATRAAAGAIPHEPPPPLLRGVRPRRSARPRSATSTRSSRQFGRTATSTACSRPRWPAVSPDRLVRSLITSRASLAAAAEGILTEAEQKLLVRRGAGGRTATSPLLDEARALLGTAAARVRARDRRRSPGPDADAAAHGRPPRARRSADDSRRRRAGNRCGALPALGRRAAAPAARRRGRRRGAAACLPRPARDHGGRVAAPRHDRPRRRTSDLLPHGR